MSSALELKFGHCILNSKSGSAPPTGCVWPWPKYVQTSKYKEGAWQALSIEEPAEIGKNVPSGASRKIFSYLLETATSSS